MLKQMCLADILPVLLSKASRPSTILCQSRLSAKNQTNCVIFASFDQQAISRILWPFLYWTKWSKKQYVRID